MTADLQVVGVALPTPLNRIFDYVVPVAGPEPGVGQRVRVEFGRRLMVGVVVQAMRALAVVEVTERARYKPVLAVLDAHPFAAADWLQALQWAADYYLHPLGEVIATAMPGLLREGGTALAPTVRHWQLTPEGSLAFATLPARQKTLRQLLTMAAEGGLQCAQGRALPGIPALTLQRALAAGYLLETLIPASAPPLPMASLPTLTAPQTTALSALTPAEHGFGVTVLEGVTGSGKTELYLRRAAQVLEQGQQVLVLVPEIGLTPQLTARFVERFGASVVGYHSGLSETERLKSWLAVRDGVARVLVGTRSAVFAPFQNLGLVVVDEEHDASFKQQEGFRYHARDFAIVRARMAQAAVVLGSATPSLETIANIEVGRYQQVLLKGRIGGEAPPQAQLIDLNHYPAREGLSEPLAAAIQRHVAAGGQALLFINRRGFAPTLFCNTCRWLAPCPHCDARLTVHRAKHQLLCHHCGYSAPIPRACPSCGGRDLSPLGEGAERIEETLKNRLPGKRVERFDSERFSSGKALRELLEDVRARRVDVLVGTQMLAKGHDFGALSLVGVINADAALYSADFRATERLAQLLTQVSGRAGRSSDAPLPPEVFIQTREPQHPLLRGLLQQGYAAIARQLLADRRAAGLPPAAHMAVLRAESGEAADAMQFLITAREAFGSPPGVECLGPAPALLARRAGRHRAQLLLLAQNRGLLRQALPEWQAALGALPLARRVRYSLDIDPADLA